MKKTKYAKKIEIKKIISGFFLLLLLHLASLILIFLIGTITRNNYNLSLIIQVYPIYLFPLWQLTYVVPLCIWLKNKDKASVMKGVIIAAIITFLIYLLGCFLLLFALT
ncbi:hypothetical protein DSM106972_059790 [Dulcicalothrix desertica PCC 7102]|uniref:Uncharacterized protein n=1 Tax=Dulcicalothrix desertica PCC 7102 TaxID=232991 RepID=A0A3S1C8W5_9CYAN|nr:hypothetical protein [Dulcicalothrix desertica]RUT02501.1 hypothetical protein DSM106972_059790 [Dulcicalothrix desertica PCC 7102]TWH55281.1 hypothetical protein CAL7102_03405 [Dulcicalothrix desertica PCC 7102]